MQEGNRYEVVGVEQMIHKKKIRDEEVDVNVAVIELITLGDKYSRVNCCKRGFYYLTS